MGAKSVVVLPPKEEQPTGIAGIIVEELRIRLAQDGVTLENDTNRAEALLTGTVLTASTVPLATAAGAELSAFSVRVTFEATLVDHHGELLWQGSFSEQDDFLPANLDAKGVLVTEANRQRALYRVAERLATRIQLSLRREHLQAAHH